MIEYSIAKKNIKLGDASSDKKVYATAQCKGTLTAKQIAEHMSSHGSKYNCADILGVLYSVAHSVWRNSCWKVIKWSCTSLARSIPSCIVKGRNLPPSSKRQNSGSPSRVPHKLLC